MKTKEQLALSVHQTVDDLIGQLNDEKPFYCSLFFHGEMTEGDQRADLMSSMGPSATEDGNGAAREAMMRAFCALGTELMKRGVSPEDLVIGLILRSAVGTDDTETTTAERVGGMGGEAFDA